MINTVLIFNASFISYHKYLIIKKIRNKIKNSALNMVRCYYLVLFIASFIGLLSLATIITVVVIWLTILKSFQDFAIVIDAGSTHTTIFLYT